MEFLSTFGGKRQSGEKNLVENGKSAKKKLVEKWQIGEKNLVKLSETSVKPEVSPREIDIQRVK